jgi:hypothetical protein
MVNSVALSRPKLALKMLFLSVKSFILNTEAIQTLIIQCIWSRYTYSFASDYVVEQRNTKFTHESKFLYLWSTDCDVWILNRQMFISINVSIVEIELVAIVLRILNASGSNLGQKTGYRDGYFVEFPVSLRKCRSLPSHPLQFIIYCHPTIERYVIWTNESIVN